MPIYEYKCSTCNVVFEKLQKMDEKDLTSRPDCGKDCKLEKMYSPCGLSFIGSGFYVNDYKRNS
jgi:putative FmdB family regulatory protein